MYKWFKNAFFRRHGCPSDWSDPHVFAFITNFTQTYHDLVAKITSEAVYGM
jgi:hypothetical protein